MPRSDKVVQARVGAKCELVCIDPARIHEFWPHIASLIRAAMVRGRISTFEQVAEAVLAAEALAWIVWDGTAIKAAVVTSLGTVNGDRICTIVACGGRDRHEWLGLLGELEVYARTEGCKAIRIFGRRGWERLLPDYRPARILLEKELQ